jgi:hypothetical protein
LPFDLFPHNFPKSYGFVPLDFFLGLKKIISAGSLLVVG